jgi:hypothetical protein
MSAPPPDTVRIGGMAGLAAGIVGAAVAIVVHFTTPVVPPTETSYPLGPGAFIWVELVLTLVRLGILAAIVALSASRVAGRSRAARIGLALALLGFTVHVLVEFGYVFAATTDDSSPLPFTLAVLFGLSTLLAAVGLILAGLGVLHAGLWKGWRRYLPLVVGVGTLLVVPLLLIDGTDTWTMTLWCLLIAALGYALATRPGPVVAGSAANRAGHVPVAAAAPSSPNSAVSDVGTSPPLTPGQSVPGEAVPGQAVPGESVPSEGVAGEVPPSQGAAGQGATSRGAAGQD